MYTHSLHVFYLLNLSKTSVVKIIWMCSFYYRAFWLWWLCSTFPRPRRFSRLLEIRTAC